MTNQDVALYISLPLYSRSLAEVTVDDRIREQAYLRGQISGISLGRTLSEYARTKGITFDQALSEIKDLPRLCQPCGMAIKTLTVCPFCGKEQ
jgi:hypothetical protein